MKYLHVKWTSPDWKRGMPIMSIMLPKLEGESNGDALGRIIQQVHALDKQVGKKADERGIVVTRSCEECDSPD